MLLVLAIWLSSGALTYAITLAYFQREFPLLAKEEYREDLGFAVLGGLIGPATIIPALCMSGFAKHGLKWR